MLSTSVAVIDDDAADALTADIDPATLQSDSTLSVPRTSARRCRTRRPPRHSASSIRHSLPYNDAFQVFLAREPAADVHIVVTSDGQTQIWNGSTYVNTITLTFEKAHSS